MKKTYPNTELGNKRCACGCGRRLKRRIVEDHPKFKFAYKCFKAECLRLGVSPTKLKSMM